MYYMYMDCTTVLPSTCTYIYITGINLSLGEPESYVMNNVFYNTNKFVPHVSNGMFKVIGFQGIIAYWGLKCNDLFAYLYEKTTVGTN